MFATRRLGSKSLADLCHRLAISIDAGIDIRKVWNREADNARGPLAAVYADIREGVGRGDTLAESIHRHPDTFPLLSRELIDVGEKTGSLAEVFDRLSKHYRRRAEMNRSLLAGITWPLLQLGMAIGVIGLVLVVFASLDTKRINGEPFDLLGFGVSGWAAVTLYVQLVVGAALAVLGAFVAIRKGVLSFKPIERFALRLPQLGPCLEKICLARMAWVLHLTLNVEIDLRRIVPLALRATGSDYYAQWSKPATNVVAAGHPLYVAFGSTGAFPAHFLDALEVAEESGQIVESMSRLSDQYDEEARTAMLMLNTILGWAIGAVIAALISIMAIRFYLIMYVGSLNDALNL